MAMTVELLGTGILEGACIVRGGDDDSFSASLTFC